MRGRQPIEGGPGWHIDPVSLRPVLDDVEQYRRHHVDDPYLDAVVLLWQGDVAAADAWLARADGPARRRRALRADAWRDMGRVDEAVAAYEALAEEARGRPDEAAMVQHLGKALLAADRITAAEEAFGRALALRRAAGADPALIESSRAALERVREIRHAQGR